MARTAWTGWASTTDGTPGVSTAGYTEITELFVNSTSDVNLSASWLVVGATPPTSVTVFGTTSAANTMNAVYAEFPPRSPVTTGDAVAVGVIAVRKAARAMSRSKGAIAKYAANAITGDAIRRYACER